MCYRTTVIPGDSLVTTTTFPDPLPGILGVGQLTCEPQLGLHHLL